MATRNNDDEKNKTALAIAIIPIPRPASTAHNASRAVIVLDDWLWGRGLKNGFFRFFLEGRAMGWIPLTNKLTVANSCYDSQ